MLPPTATMYRISLILFLLCGLTLTGKAQCPPNIDFEQGSLANWNCFIGSVPAQVYTATPPVPGRHDITVGAGLDPYGGFPIVAPGGGQYSMKLGNDQTGSQTEKVIYNLTVPVGPSVYTLYFRYAVVFQNPPNHLPNEQPFFRVLAYDAASGHPIACDSNMFVSSGILPGFIETSPGSDIWYKEWSAGTLKLDGAGGMNINIEFTSADCTLGGHFGYGYVDMNCGNYAIIAANCNNAPTTPLTAPPGFMNYTWYNDNYSSVLGSTQTIVVPTPTSGNPTYHVVLTPYPGYGCIDTLSTEIRFSTLTVDATPNTVVNLCNTASVQLNTTQIGSAPPFTYAWTPSAGLSCVACPNPVASPSVNTTYVVSVTDHIGCTIADSVSIIAAIHLTTSQTNTTCANSTDGTATANPTGGTPPYSFSWNTTPVQTTQTAAGLGTGPHTVTVTDANGCTATATVYITVATASVNVGVNNVSCFGANNGSAAVTSTFGTPPDTYSWNTTPVQTTQGITGLAPGSYTVTVTDAAGCTVNRTVFITQPTVLSVTGTATNELCAGQHNGEVIMTATGGTQAYSYSWNTTPVQNTASANNLAPGNYTGTVTDANGCTANVTKTVGTTSTIHLNTVVTTRSCPGEAHSIVVATGTGGIGTLHYTWNTSPPVTTPALANVRAGTYIVLVTDSLGCAKMDTAIVTDYPAPAITVSQDKEICLGEQVGLVVNGAVTYYWSPPNALSCITCPNPTASPTVTTTYTVIGTDNNGCKDTADVTISVIGREVVSIAGFAKICRGDKIMLGAAGGADYTWTPAESLDNPFIATPVAQPDSTTTYTVVISENRCFKDTLTQTIEVMPLPTIEIGRGFNGIPGATVQLHPAVTGAQSIRWAPPQGLSCTDCYEPVVTLDKNITYLAEVTDSNGCKAVDTIRILVSCDATAFYMANTFTPNNDGNNDYFYPQAFGVNTVQRFMVYNRWGEVMFSATNIPVNIAERGWNGTYKGKDLSPDVFVYVVEALCADGTPVVVKGDIALVR